MTGASKGGILFWNVSSCLWKTLNPCTITPPSPSSLHQDTVLQQLHIVTQSVVLGPYCFAAGPPHLDHGSPCTDELAQAFIDGVTALAVPGESNSFLDGGHSALAHNVGRHHGEKRQPLSASVAAASDGGAFVGGGEGGSGREGSGHYGDNVFYGGGWELVLAQGGGMLDLVLSR